MDQGAKETGAETEYTTVQNTLEKLEDEEQDMASSIPQPPEGEKIKDPTVEQQDQDKKASEDQEEVPPTSMCEKDEEMTDTVEEHTTDSKDENTEDQETTKITPEEKDEEMTDTVKEHTTDSKDENTEDQETTKTTPEEKDEEITDTVEEYTTETKDENTEDQETTKTTPEEEVITIDEDTTDTEETPKLTIEENDEVLDLTIDEQSDDDLIMKSPESEKVLEDSDENALTIDEEASEQQSKFREASETAEQEFADMPDPRFPTARSDYPCGECPRRFTNLQDLNEHIMAHINILEQAFTCDYCGEMFQFEGQIVLHISLRHNNGELDCNICGRSFKYKRQLDNHYKLHKYRTVKSQYKRFKKLPTLKGYEKKVELGEASGAQAGPNAGPSDETGGDNKDDDEDTP